MRISILLFSFFILSYTSRSQVLISLIFGDELNTGKIEFGLDGGVSYPEIRGLDNGNLKANFNLGFYFDIKIGHPKWLFNSGVMVKSSLGTSGLPTYSIGSPDLDNAFSGGEVRRKINYFNVPFAMKYKITAHFFVLGGIMPSLRSKAYDFFTANVQGNELEYKVDISNQILRLDFGLIGGFGYRIFKGYGMNLTARYYYGLVNIAEDNSAPKQYNSSLFLTFGIPVGVKKALAKKEADQK